MPFRVSPIVAAFKRAAPNRAAQRCTEKENNPTAASSEHFSTVPVPSQPLQQETVSNSALSPHRQRSSQNILTISQRGLICKWMSETASSC